MASRRSRLDSVTLDERVNRLSGDERGASQLDLLELAFAKEFVNGGFAQAESLCDFVNLIGNALQVGLPLYGYERARSDAHTCDCRCAC